MGFCLPELSLHFPGSIDIKAILFQAWCVTDYSHLSCCFPDDCVCSASFISLREKEIDQNWKEGGGGCWNTGNRGGRAALCGTPDPFQGENLHGGLVNEDTRYTHTPSLAEIIAAVAFSFKGKGQYIEIGEASHLTIESPSGVIAKKKCLNGCLQLFWNQKIQRKYFIMVFILKIKQTKHL